MTSSMILRHIHANINEKKKTKFDPVNYSWVISGKLASKIGHNNIQKVIYIIRSAFFRCLGLALSPSRMQEKPSFVIRSEYFQLPSIYMR